jgi:hypothetical protein
MGIDASYWSIMFWLIAVTVGLPFGRAILLVRTARAHAIARRPGRC